LQTEFSTFVVQELAHFPLPRVQGPLPEESTFVVAARDSIPAPRATTAQNRGRARGTSSNRGRGRARGATTSQPPARGRGRARGTSKVVPASDASTSQPSARGREKGTKRKAHKMKSLSKLTKVPEEIANTQNAPQ
jgi:hypothetical protein